MIRFSTLLWLTLVAAVSFAMFEVKYAVMDLEDQLAKVNRKIVADDDAIHVLKAEWSYLAQPSRLDDLSHRFLNLGPIGTKQLATIDSIPMRPVPPAIADAATSGVAVPVAAKSPVAGSPIGVKPAAPVVNPTRLANAKLRTER